MTYSEDHPYRKDAKAFIRGLKTRQAIIAAGETGSARHMRLNRRLNQLKWGYWAIHPKGTEEYYQIYPNSPRK